MAANSLDHTGCFAKLSGLTMATQVFDFRTALNRIGQASRLLLAGATAVLFLTACGNQAAPRPTPVSATQIPELSAKADKGDADAQRTLGGAYARGEGVKQDYQEAAKWYQRAATNGNAAAQTALGELFEAGQGVPHDYAQAAAWYRRAAEQGLSGAQYNLAALYAVGKGVPLDNAEALKWYVQAANQGDSLAQYNVGMRYFEAHGIKRDLEQAYKWLSLAAAQGLPDAAQALNSVKAKISSEQLDRARTLVREFKPVSQVNR
jgi:TPR repeat protein